MWTGLADATGLTPASRVGWQVGSGWMTQDGLTQMSGIQRVLRKGLAASARGLSPSSRLARAHFHGGVRAPSAARGQAQCSSTFKASACIPFANVPLAKVTHTAKPDSRSGQTDCAS